MSNSLAPLQPFAEPDTDPQRPLPTEWPVYEARLKSDWANVLGASPDEKVVQSFLERNPCLLPLTGSAGHHGIQGDALFTQPPLQGVGMNRVPDFMWITAHSKAVIPIFIEIERPGKLHFNPSSPDTFSADFNQAHSQLTQWKSWWNNPTNQNVFREQILDPIWDYRGRAVKPQYVLIYGRSSEFNQGPPNHRANMVLEREGKDEHIITYDRLKPDVNLSIFPTVRQHSSGETSLKGVPPSFTTGPAMKELARRIPDPEPSVFENSLWTHERSHYVHQRWIHWAGNQSGSCRDVLGE